MQQSLLEHEKTVYVTGLAVLLLAAGFLLWIASKLFWQLFPIDENSTPRSAQIQTTQPLASPTKTDIGAMHLFGDTGQAVFLPVGFDAPETTLDLKLFGTFAVEDKPEEGYAIIGDSEGREGHFRAGDTIPGDATLREVHPDRVILMRAGTLETLRLRSDDGNEPSEFRRRNNRRQVASQAARQNHSAIRQSGSPAIPAINAIDMQAMQQLRLDPAQLAQQIQARPHIVDGKQIGIRLDAGRNSDLLQRAGLRRTDVIMSVNGVSLDNPVAGMSLIPKLQSESSLTVTVLRDGREITQTIELNR